MFVFFSSPLAAFGAVALSVSVFSPSSLTPSQGKES